MSRLVWVGVGAAGGILVYRRSQRAWDRTKERGVAGNTAALTRTAAAIYRGIRDAEEPEVVDITGNASTARVIAGEAEVIDPQAPLEPAARSGPRRKTAG